MKKMMLLLLLFCFHLLAGQTRFSHILITNDDGITDADRLLALAKAVSQVADRVSVMVPAFDRSGTSNHSLYGKHQSTFQVTCRYHDKKDNITAYTLPANPADCIYLGLCGFFGDDRPDLVLSGINGGPNIGPNWFGSGTIGAARTAAFLGVSAVAFSGFDDDNKEFFTSIPEWIKDLISSGFVNDLSKNSYLTVGFPRIPIKDIKGIKLAERRISYDRPGRINLKKIDGKEPHLPDNMTIWVLSGGKDLITRNQIKDDTWLQKGYIIITPMTIDENNQTLLNQLKKKRSLIPSLK